MPDAVRRVPPQEWRAAVAAALASGNTWFDWLGATDEIGREDAFRVLIRLAPTPDADGVRLETLTAGREDPHLPSLRDLIAGAAWHEREVRDFFGITFDGGDNRPLLLRPDAVGHPLRRDAVLAARVARPWPGGKEPGEAASAARRRMVPPGVPDPDVWGEREGEPAAPEEVAASLQGGRVRRRR
ncbi:NADH-quinone oxidoreductase subunit C [Propioniciclava coleopterorum]|uniref:NADH-quinone oxidoreductase subunit C n=1 Tax=Propioniciclava coleopterorum TaxID=2714937 RepID=A0A6G7Y3T1_9ACTN|nr:NADH-quinone oxidoreductase subunit C [Propioniciclava coleopterorum]QIK71480.1 NADH-quinone oxidoreductase subunit C [Propioniciclava coleopterorum]